MIVGYIRVSSADQNIGRQETLLEGYVDKEHIYIDRLSGKDKHRPAFEEMIRFVRNGDEIYVCSTDRLVRNLKDLLEFIDYMNKKGVCVHFLKENWTMTPGSGDAIGKMVVSVLGAVAEFERSLILERQAEGIALAKAKGVYKGRKPISQDIVNKIRSEREMGIPVRRIAKDVGVSEVTCWRYLKQNVSAVS